MVIQFLEFSRLTGTSDLRGLGKCWPRQENRKAQDADCQQPGAIQKPSIQCHKTTGDHETSKTTKARMSSHGNIILLREYLARIVPRTQNPWKKI
jgi:hypothetical protein